MKSVLCLLFLFVCLNHSSFSQSLSNLDTKFGIGKFKLESSYEEYKDQLNFFMDKQKIQHYLYGRGDIRELFDYPIYDIHLGFYKNKLYFIQYTLQATTQRDGEILLDKLESLFGKGNFDNINTDSMLYGYTWRTNKTHLQLVKLGPKNVGRPNMYQIFISSLKLEYEINNNSF